MKLTEPQVRELRRLADGPQHTFGRHRARVQRGLYRLCLARFVNDDGKEATNIALAPTCEITETGRAFLKEVK